MYSNHTDADLTNIRWFSCGLPGNKNINNNQREVLIIKNNNT